MEFLEKDLEQIIWETDSETLHDRGLPFYGKRYRQLKIGNYGIADLVTFKRGIGFNHINFNVVELKKDGVNFSTLSQACGYVKGISRYLEIRGFTSTGTITLIGKSIDVSNNSCYIPDVFDDMVSVFTYKIDINGLWFDSHQGYKLRDEGFTTKYRKTCRN